MASNHGLAGGVHVPGISAVQRASLRAVLSLLLLIGASAHAQSFDFDPDITQEELDEISLSAAEAIWASPVDSPASTSLFNFEIGIAVTTVEVEEAEPWIDQISEDILVDGRLLVPRLTVTKGIGFGSVSAAYGQVGDSDAKMAGGSFDFPLLRGGLAVPSVALRGVYSRLLDVEDADLSTWGGMVMIGKKIGPVTPYAGWGKMWVESEARIGGSGIIDPFIMTSETDQEMIVAGGKIDLAFLKLAVEGTQTDGDWQYGARVGLGF